MTGTARASKLRDALLAFVCVGFVVASVLAVVGYLRANTADSHADHFAKVATANSQGLAKANTRLTDLGAQPVPTPSPGAAGPTGERGANGQNATDEQVSAAVAVYMSDHPVTAAKIDYSKLRAFVVAYLKAHPAPSGSPGASGAAGRNGSDGSNGADGKDATDAQVASAVAAYLAANPPASGPAGPSGAAGQNGKDGQPPVSWTYTIGPITYECDRTDPFDPTEPTYTCAPQPTTTPTGTP